MNALVLGGTRFFGIHLVNELIQAGHEVTIATRGRTKDRFGNQVNRLIIDRTDTESLKAALSMKHFNVTYDNLAYCSNDVKHLLDHLNTDRYVMTSTCSVYDLQPNMTEDHFDPLKHELIWCNRNDFAYDEIKRQAECALFQAYANINSVAMRIPFVIGADDYTRRLFFYIEHIAQGKSIWIDNLDSQICFITSNEAGRFMAWLGMQTNKGPINGCSSGTISLRYITDYVQERLNRQMQLDENGDPAPFNSCPSFDLNTEKAAAMGFPFSNIEEWIRDLLDYFIKTWCP